MALFFNTNAMNSSNSEFDLASLLNMNIANAEQPDFGACIWDVHYYYNNGYGQTWTKTCYSGGGDSC